jgi:hypothetical protein
MRSRVFIFLGVIALFAVGMTYAVNQPSVECESQKEVAKLDWDRARSAESLANDQYLSAVFGDIQNPDSELKYEKSLYELRRIAHLYKISASKRTLENQECFSENEISNAQVELEVQKSFVGYFAE